MIPAHPTITTLDPWIATRIRGGTKDLSPLQPDELRAFQLRRLQHLVAHVRRNSPFYRQRLAFLPPEGVRALSQLAILPLTTEEEIRQQGERMVCVPQDAVARIITLTSSGTTGEAKRLQFSAADLESTLDFFHHGMQTLVAPGQTVLILLPGSTSSKSN